MIPIQFVQTNKGEERQHKKWRRGTIHITKLKEYDVFATIDGERVKVGRVFQDLATFERKTPGRTYVNARWSSPRWYAQLPSAYVRGSYFESRREATEGLMKAWEQEHQRVDA